MSNTGGVFVHALCKLEEDEQGVCTGRSCLPNCAYIDEDEAQAELDKLNVEDKCYWTLKTIWIPYRDCYK